MRSANKTRNDTIPSNVYFANARSYEALADVEADFFSALAKNRGEFSGNHSIYRALEQSTSFIQDPRGRSLDILVEFEVTDPRGGPPVALMLGTQVHPSKPGSAAQYTQILCLADKKALLTKVHLDREFTVHVKEKKPSPHIQFGGRVHKELAAKASEIHWNIDIDKPRIPSLPFCSALLWHWAFLEYRSEKRFAAILDASWWKNIVKTAEERIVVPFLEDGLHLLRRQPSPGFLCALYTPLDR